MPFIGNQPSNNFVSLERQDITGDGGATYTLDHSVASVNDVLIYVNHVKQDPSSYSISNTSLTMGGNVASTDDFYVIFLGQALQTVTPKDNTITTAMLQDDAVTLAKTDGNFGKVLQVVQTVKTDTFTSTSTSFTDITGLSVSITPASTSNKVLVFAHIVGHGEIGANHAVFRIVRGSTTIYAGDTAGSRPSGFHSGMATDTNSAQSGTGVFLDSPSSSSATTYKIQGLTNVGTFYVNRSPNDANSTGRIRAASSITVMEIAG